MAKVGEESSEEDDDGGVQRALQFWHHQVQVAFQNGLNYIEAFQCNKCKKRQFFVHTGGEVIKCMACGEVHPSQVPVRPTAGEKTLHHMECAFGTMLKNSLAATQLLPRLAEQEIQNLSPEMKLVLARFREQVIAHTIVRGLELTNQMALNST